MKESFECNDSFKAYEIMQKCKVDYGIIGKAKELHKHYSEMSGVWYLESGSCSSLTHYISNVLAKEITVNAYWNGGKKAFLSIVYDAGYYGEQMISTSTYEFTPNDSENNDPYVFREEHSVLHKAYIDSGKFIFEEYDFKNSITKKAIYVKS